MSHRVRTEIPDVFAPTDPLADALQFLRMSAAFCVDAECSAPWALALPRMDGCLAFHVLVTGTCTVEADDATHELRPGEFVLLPRADAHVLRQSRHARAAALFDLPHDYTGPHFARLRFGGGGDTTRMICGVLRCDLPGARYVLEALPKIVHVSGGPTSESSWMENTMRFMRDEARTTRPGSESLLSRLADIVVIQGIRSWVSSDAASSTGLFAGLRDHQIGRALAGFHRNAEHAWTLSALAKIAAMSRSAFAARFVALVGESPMQYVTRWRMYAAHSALRENAMSIAAVAARVGYRSEAAFSRAFKRVIGSPPGTLRREQTPAPLPWMRQSTS